MKLHHIHKIKKIKIKDSVIKSMLFFHNSQVNMLTWVLAKKNNKNKNKTKKAMTMVKSMVVVCFKAALDSQEVDEY